MFHPANLSDAELKSLRGQDLDDEGGVLALAAACFDEFCMQPGALLAIRDGARGSFLYSRPAPEAPAWQWLADIGRREHEWLAHVPACPLERVADPTGAGNAYIGALTARVAEGVDWKEAAATATAVGAAFCASEDWAPADMSVAREEVRRWAEEVKNRIHVLRGMGMDVAS